MLDNHMLHSLDYAQLHRLAQCCGYIVHLGWRVVHHHPWGEGDQQVETPQCVVGVLHCSQGAL